MWHRKKIIIIGLLVTVLVLGSIGVAALAQTGSDSTQSKTLMGRVAEILGIDQQQLEDAFTQARTEMRDDALNTYLQGLVDKGTITQAEADQYKAWANSRPDMSQFQQQLRDWQQARPGVPPELKDWQQGQPDIPLPRHFGGPGFPGGMRGGRLFGSR